MAQMRVSSARGDHALSRRMGIISKTPYVVRVTPEFIVGYCCLQCSSDLRDYI